MYPAPFEYSAPRSLDEALAQLAEVGEEGRVLAGGQSLIPMMKLRLAEPAHLVDINRIPDLDQIGVDNGHLSIGALVRHAQMASSDVVSEHSSLMASAAPWISDPLVRNRGTLCGSVAHCDPEGDWNSVMLALGATVVARSTDGERRIPISEFAVDFFTNSLQPGEMVVGVEVPKDGPRSGGSYLKLERKIGDYATVGVATQIDLDDAGKIASAGLALTSVGSINIAVSEAPRMMTGEEPTAGTLLRGGQPRLDDVRSRGRCARSRRVQAGGGQDLHGAGFRQGAGHGAAGGGVMQVSVTVNGAAYEREVEPRKLLVDFIRSDLGLTGTHIGCDTTNCGACTVLVDGVPMKSCTMLAVQADGSSLRTVEGLKQNGQLHPIQAAFKEHHGLQCGFCTPGMMLVGTALIEENPSPTDDEVRWAISGNICRCTGYTTIVTAIQAAGETMAATRIEEMA